MAIPALDRAASKAARAAGPSPVPTLTCMCTIGLLRATHNAQTAVPHLAAAAARRQRRTRPSQARPPPPWGAQVLGRQLRGSHPQPHAARPARYGRREAARHSAWRRALAGGARSPLVGDRCSLGRGFPPSSGKQPCSSTLASPVSVGDPPGDRRTWARERHGYEVAGPHRQRRSALCGCQRAWRPSVRQEIRMGLGQFHSLFIARITAPVNGFGHTIGNGSRIFRSDIGATGS